MDVGDGENEVSVSSLILNSIESHQKEVLSPEDLAWADSCLVKGTDISESEWNPLKNALLEIISSQPESSNIDGGAGIEILPSTEEKETTEFQGTEHNFMSVSVSAERSTDDVPDNGKSKTMSSSTFQESPSVPISNGKMKEIKSTDLGLNLDSSTYYMEHSSEPSSIYDILPVSIAAEASAGDIPENEKTGTLPSLTFQGNPFLPTYNEYLKENETVDSGLSLDSSTYDMEPSSEISLDSSTYDMEPSSEDIFKIWDLDIPSEDGELVLQLNRVLAENSFQMTPSSFDDSGQWKVLKEYSVDNLIDGIADLSLDENAS